MWKKPKHNGEYVILQRRDEETESGIVIGNQGNNVAVVISADNLEVGTIVVFVGETKFNYNDKEYLVVREDNVMAILGSEEW